MLLGVDGCPAHLVSPASTPRLWTLGETGGLTLEGRAPLPSTTYPCFATLLTGCLPRQHTVRTTAWDPGAARGWAGRRRVAVPTLFDACRGAGLGSAAVQGDHLLHAVLGTEAAGMTWPPGGTTPPDAPCDAHGYPTNDAVKPHLLAAAADPATDFLFGQLNEGDTLGHDLGPDDPATRACYAAADRIIGELLDLLQARWEEIVVVVVSDHGMEPRGDRPPIDLMASPTVRAVAAAVLGDGGAALVRVRDGVEEAEAGAALAGVPGIAGWSRDAEGFLIAEARPGWIFRAPRLPARGYHGGRTTARTFAVVGGGHPAVPVIARSFPVRPPHLADWAPTIARLLRIELPGVDGQDLSTG